MTACCVLSRWLHTTESAVVAGVEDWNRPGRLLATVDRRILCVGQVFAWSKLVFAACKLLLARRSLPQHLLSSLFQLLTPDPPDATSRNDEFVPPFSVRPKSRIQGRGRGGGGGGRFGGGGYGGGGGGGYGGGGYGGGGGGYGDRARDSGRDSYRRRSRSRDRCASQCFVAVHLGDVCFAFVCGICIRLLCESCVPEPAGQPANPAKWCSLVARFIHSSAEVCWRQLPTKLFFLCCFVAVAQVRSTHSPA